jgi:hypothetical protein
MWFVFQNVTLQPHHGLNARCLAAFFAGGCHAAVDSVAYTGFAAAARATRNLITTKDCNQLISRSGYF